MAARPSTTQQGQAPVSGQAQGNVTASFDLDIIGVLEGTDKSSSVAYGWDYLRHYQQLFAPFRHEPINFIEIGVQRGPSLNVWRSFFTRATIIGIDVDPSCARLAADRVVIAIGSQEDPGFLHRVVAQYPPTIIVDDGSHLAHHVVYTFERLFPALLPGGIYVVEDLAFHYGDRAAQWAGNGSVAPGRYFATLGQACVAGTPLDADAWGTARYIVEQTDHIALFHSAAAIHKRQPRDLTAALATANDYLRADSHPDAFARFAQYVVRHAGPLDAAENVVRRGLGRNSEDATLLRALADLQWRQQHIEEATKNARRATELAPDDTEALRLLGRLEGLRGRHGEAVAVLGAAVALRPDNPALHHELSQALDRHGDLEKAIASAERAAELRVGQAGGVFFENWANQLRQRRR